MAEKTKNNTNQSDQSSETKSLTGIKGKIIKPNQVKPGNTVRVHQKIVEITPKGDEKERIQIFEGIVLGIRGSKISRTMTVRKVSDGVGVEKILPLNLPSIAAIELIKTAKVRRAKIGYTKNSKKRLKEKMV